NQLKEITQATLSHYNNHAMGFRDGTWDHDVSQNYQAFFEALPNRMPLKILDLGCGSAPWSLAMAVADPTSQVVAIDFPPILEVAQSYVKRFHATKQFELRPGDIHELRYERENYDLVILGHILHGEGEAGSKKLIKKAYDALKPGGKILISEFVANDLKSGPEIPLLFALNMLLFTEHGDVFTIKDLKRWLSLSGFKKASAQAVQYPVTVMVGTK
ncbi:MAG: class I SAM-dependent methyltransferase, partial [bacterium]|nr:class I SAM-dependent methyltransferase [bacterium]